MSIKQTVSIYSQILTQTIKVLITQFTRSRFTTFPEFASIIYRIWCMREISVHGLLSSPCRCVQ